MSNLWLWLLLSSLTGSPLGSAVALLVFWWLVDRFTVGVLPDPLRWVLRRQRAALLERQLLANPHDGRARLELAQLLVERGAGRRAVEVLKPTVEAGADDVQSVFTLGAACLQAGYHEQGEKLLAHARELDPRFRVGEIDLVLGAARLGRGDFAGAKAALEALVQARKGTVRGRVLLARAQAGLGDDAAAALLRDEAWEEYRAAPAFQRRQERLWAWRARPSRPATWALVVVLVFAGFVTVVAPRLSQWAQQQRADGLFVDPSLQEPDE